MGALTRSFRVYEDPVHGSSEAQMSSVETDLTERIWKLEDKIAETHQKLSKELKEGLLQALSVQTRAPVIRSRHPPARERGYTPQAHLWFFLCEYEENMRRWDGKSTSVLAARVHKLKEETSRGGSSRMNVAPVSQDQDARYNRAEDDRSEPLEGTSRRYAQERNNSQD